MLVNVGQLQTQMLVKCWSLLTNTKPQQLRGELANVGLLVMFARLSLGEKVTNMTNMPTNGAKTRAVTGEIVLVTFDQH